MSNGNDGLILHLSLAEISDNNEVLDSSAQGYDGTLNGDPRLVEDDTFGSCLSFDGTKDYIDTGLLFPSITDSFTMQAWVWPSATHEIDSEADKGTSGLEGQRYLIWPTHGSGAYEEGHAGVGVSVGTNGITVYEHANGYMPASLVWSGEVKQWTHLAVVYNQGRPALYVNGVLVKTGLQSSRTVHPSAGKGDVYAGQFGGFGGGSYGFFAGKMTHVRLYSQALSVAEIKRDMDTDLTAWASFRKSYPLEFDLYDEDDQSVVYISDDPTGRNLTLEIRNTSPQVLEAKAVAEPPHVESAEAYFKKHHHFELRFRPETLSRVTVGSKASPSPLTLIEPNGWRMSQPQVNSNGTISLYFLSTTAQSLKPLQKITLPLQHISAAAGGGSRGTRVELRYKALHYSGNQATPLTGHRVRHLNIINHRGRKYIPVHVGFLGSNVILNGAPKDSAPEDGDPTNHLKLRITNTLKDGPLSLNPIGSDAPSKLILSFDCGDNNKEWGLATTSQVGGITAAIVDAKGQLDPNWPIKKEGAVGECPEWVITTTNTKLEAGQHIQLNLSNIISSLPSGHANLYLRYENIPGYWDGQFVVVVEKSPLLYRDNRVGIGTSKPGWELTVEGELVVHKTVGKKRKGWAGYWHNDNYVTINAYDWDERSLQPLRLDGSQLILNSGGGKVGIGTTNPNAGLEIGKDTTYEPALRLTSPGSGWGAGLQFTNTASQGKTYGIYTDQKGFWRFVDKDKQANRLLIDKDGNLGINTDTPSQRLTVGGGHLQIDGNQVMGSFLNEMFTYHGKSMGHYSLGWFHDSEYTGGATAWISAYGGFKFFTDGTPKLKIDVRGNIRYTASLERSSTRTLKDNITDLSTQEAYDTLGGLHPVKFTLKADEQKQPHLGFIAEEVPDVISSQDGQAINPDNIIAVLTRVIKDQQQAILTLEEKLNTLIK